MSKELAYKIYTMKLGEQIEIIEYEIYCLRVPGGWIIKDVFVPYNDEFYGLAMSPKLKGIKLRCPKCRGVFSCNEKEDFQEKKYICVYCQNEFNYEK